MVFYIARKSVVYFLPSGLNGIPQGVAHFLILPQSEVPIIILADQRIKVAGPFHRISPNGDQLPSAYGPNICDSTLVENKVCVLPTQTPPLWR